MTIYSVKFYIFWANSGLCHFHSRFVNSLNLDGSALSLMYMRTSSVCVILPALCRVTASELRDAGRQKPVTCLEPVLSVSLGPRPVFPRSEQVASAGIIPACASLSLSFCCCKKISWLWPGTFLSHRDWCGLAGSPVCSPSPCMHV